MNLLCVGSATSLEIQNAIISFRSIGYDVLLLNVSRDYFPNNIEGIPNYKNIINLYQGLSGISKSKVIRRIERLLIVVLFIPWLFGFLVLVSLFPLFYI